MLSPLAVWLALRFRFRSGQRLFVTGLHLLASVLLDVLALLSMATLQHWRESQRLTFDGSIRQSISMHFVPNLMEYWMVIGLVHLWHYYNDARREEVRSARLRGELAHARLTVLKSQLHPHFLFNALHSVASLLHEDVLVAEDLLLRLSRLLRAMLDDTYSQEIPLRKEILILDWHLGIERIRYGDRLTTRTQIEDDVLDCAVPHLILQTLVENAIRHGIGKHPGPDEVSIQARRVGTDLRIEVANSNSVLLMSNNEVLRQGVGLVNMQSRLKELYGGKSFLSLVSLEPRGVSVTVSLPFRKLATDNASMAQVVR
jgi:LytS/YehU family sensor histidine kinase